jgi:hypothetical protein
MSTAEATLSGVITDSTSGEPLSGISVAIFNNSTNRKLTATTDSSGAYAIQSIPVGTYNVELEGDEYTVNDYDDVSLPAGSTELNFSMKKSGNVPGEEAGAGPASGSGTSKLRITGTVVSGGETETGMEGGTIVLLPTTNVSGATVNVTNADTGVLLGTTTSDSSGNFSVEVAVESIKITATKNGTQYATENVNEEAIGGDIIT